MSEGETAEEGAGSLIVRGGDVLMPDGAHQRADVEVRNGAIQAVTMLAADTGATTRLSVSGAAETAGTEEVLDASGMVVAPGFVDLQCNGAVGIDLTAEPERMWEVAAQLPRWGVTAWLPTIVTSPADVRERALAAFAGGPPSGWSGAMPLGLHFEGPFLNPERRGAHAQRHLAQPDAATVAAWSRSEGVSVVTLAPELPGALDLVRLLVERGIVVSAGHSAATVEEAKAAVDAGVRWVTHLFNGMAPLHHRDPGLAAVGLTDDRLAVGMIVDGVHLHPTAVDLVARTCAGRMTLVTDAVAALGVPPGKVRLGDVEALADGEGVRLADGTLAGSILSMNQAVANLMAFTGCDLATAVTAAASTPARLLGQADQRGTVHPGAAADLVLLDVDQGTERVSTIAVAATVVAGRVVYRRDRDGRDEAGGGG